MMFFVGLLANMFACSAALTKHSHHRMSASMSGVSWMRRGDEYTDVKVDISATGAACLDGSPFYFTYYPGTSNRWTIEFHSIGVGCYSFEDDHNNDGTGSDTNCATRAEESGGSSLNNTHSSCECRNFDEMGNNESCNCISLLNCDASMMAGYLEEPLENGGQKYYSRGRRNVNATLDILIDEYGLSTATDVVLYGHSGAAVAALVALDVARAIIPDSVTVSALSIGGFIPEWEDAKEDYMYIDEMKRMYEFHSLQDQLSSDCTGAHVSEEWLCLLAPHAIKHVKTPVFFMNSHYDAWQLIKVDTLDIEDIYENMSGIGKDHDEVEAYGAEWLSQFEASVTSGGPHGAYITSCICHCSCGPNATSFISWEDPLMMYVNWYSNPTFDVYVDPDEANYYCNNGVLP